VLASAPSSSSAILASGTCRSKRSLERREREECERARERILDGAPAPPPALALPHLHLNLHSRQRRPPLGVPASSRHTALGCRRGRPRHALPPPAATRSGTAILAVVHPVDISAEHESPGAFSRAKANRTAQERGAPHSRFGRESQITANPKESCPSDH
jgi:hypothetical protein